MINFDNFYTIGNRNEYTTKHVQTVSLQPDNVSTLTGKTKNNTKTADRLLLCILLNRMFQTFAESRSMFVSFRIGNFFSSFLTENQFSDRKSFTFSRVQLEIYLQTQYG